MKKSKQVSIDNEPPTYQEATAGYDEMEAQFAWDDKTIRRTFIRKVYAILMLQLFVTVGIVCLFTFCAPVRFYIQTHPGLYSASYLMFFSTYIALSCCGDLRRQFPWNIILLVIFTLSMAFMMGFLSSFYNTKSVLLCLGITALVCLSVTIFSFQSKIDVTSCQGVLFSLCMVMLLCAITLSIVVPFGYVSSRLLLFILDALQKQTKLAEVNDELNNSCRLKPQVLLPVLRHGSLRDGINLEQIISRCFGLPKLARCSPS
uniref:Protein lifeguard 2 n=1 Tax=Kryptolebias marmoratus TaxID=37003 RepID=A0A3Q3B2S5_KRYMA